MPAIINLDNPETRLDITVTAFRREFEESGKLNSIEFSRHDNRVFIKAKAIETGQTISIQIKMKEGKTCVKVGTTDTQIADIVRACMARANADIEAIARSQETPLSEEELERLALWQRITAHILKLTAVPEILEVDVEGNGREEMTITLRRIRANGQWGTSVIKVRNSRKRIQTTVSTSSTIETAGVTKLILLLASYIDQMEPEYMERCVNIGPPIWPSILSLIDLM